MAGGDCPGDFGPGGYRPGLAVAEPRQVRLAQAPNLPGVAQQPAAGRGGPAPAAAQPPAGPAGGSGLVLEIGGCGVARPVPGAGRAPAQRFPRRRPPAQGLERIGRGMAGPGGATAARDPRAARQLQRGGLAAASKCFGEPGPEPVGASPVGVGQCPKPVAGQARFRHAAGTFPPALVCRGGAEPRQRAD